MSEPERGRWLDDLASELRSEVPVRAAWRAHLLAEVARSPRPLDVTDTDELDELDELDDAARAGGEAPFVTRRRGDARIAVRPLVAIAAALVFAALGAGATLATLAWRERASASARGAPLDGQATTPLVTDARVPDEPGALVREPVRFALAAPQASRVALVGSFNRWNPAATPLVRDSVTGEWTVTLRLPPGRHVYAFVVDGAVRTDPAAPRTADDDFGAPSSVILVAGPAS